MFLVCLLTCITFHISVSVYPTVCLSSEIMLDLLPTLQSPDSARVLIDLIRDETIRGIRSHLSISAMSLTVIPAPEVATSLLVCIT